MKISDIADCITLFFCSFPIIAIVLSKTELNFLSRIALAFILGAIITFLYAGNKIKKRKRYVKNKNEEKLYTQIKHQLIFSTQSENLKLITNLFKKEKNVSDKTNATFNNCKLFLNFGFEETSADYCVNCYKQTDIEHKTLIVCSTASEQAKALCEKLSQRIILKDDLKLFALMKKHNVFPTIKIDLTEKKKNFKYAFKEILNKKNSARLTFCGIILIMTSYFTMFPFYYITIGTALCLLGLTAFFFGKKKPI